MKSLRLGPEVLSELDTFSPGARGIVPASHVVFEASQFALVVCATIEGQMLSGLVDAGPPLPRGSRHATVDELIDLRRAALRRAN